jgi:ubiquinone/menaquinone biosynthesis C-methylase UbiE
MIKKINLFTSYHTKTKRNYLHRMLDDKVKCMEIAKKFERSYWDGSRRYGYGGYKYIDGYWTNFAKKLIKTFKLKSNSKVLDLGCGKGFLIYEIKKILPNIKIQGLDISKYALKNSKPEISKHLRWADARKKLIYKNKSFDLLICMGLLHNFNIFQISSVLKEIKRVSKKSYIMVESYRSNKELFNLQCWALTCESFLKPSEWLYLLKKNNINGRYEFIYFN